MRGWSLGLSVLALFLGSMACGSRGASPEPAAAPGASATKPVGPPTYPSVEAPEDVMVWARLTAPARDLPVLAAFGMLPQDVAEGLANPRKSLELLLGAELAGPVNLDAPVDFLFPDQDRAKEWTIAFTAHPEEHVSETDLTLVRVGTQRWRIDAPGAPSRIVRICELWRGAPPSGSRILCSTSAERLAADAPFLMGTAPRHVGDAGLRIAIPGPGYRHGLQEKMQDIEEDAADTTEALGTRLVADTVAEHDGIALDLTFGEAVVEVGMEVGFTSTQAPLNTWLAGEPTGPGVLPGFWKLPAASDLALSKGRIDGRALRDTATPLLEKMLQLSLEDSQTTAADRAEIERAIVGIAPSGGGLSFATGRNSAGARWYLVGVEESATEYAAAVREFVRQAQRRFPDRPGRGADEDGAEEPSSAEASLSELSLVDESPTSLPEGSLQLLATEKPAPDVGAPAGSTDESSGPALDEVHLFVVPDGPRVWLSWADDATTALAQARGVLGKDGKKDLRAIPQLANHSERAVAGFGFTTLRGLMGLATDADTRAAALPNGGETPIPLWLERRLPAAGSPRSVTLRLAGKLHPDVVMDAVAWMLLTVAPDGGSE